jgi:hypothetical protein
MGIAKFAGNAFPRFSDVNRKHNLDQRQGPSRGEWACSAKQLWPLIISPDYPLAQFRVASVGRRKRKDGGGLVKREWSRGREEE